MSDNMTTKPEEHRTQTQEAGSPPYKPGTAVDTSELPPVPPKPPTAHESSELLEERERKKSINELTEQLRQRLHSNVDWYVEELKQRALSSLTPRDPYESRRRRLEQQREGRPQRKLKLADILKSYKIGDTFTLQELVNSTGFRTIEISSLLVNYGQEWGIERDQNIHGKYSKVREVGKERIRMSQDMTQAVERLRSAISKYPIGTEFTLDDLSEATGFTPRSIRAYLNPQYFSGSQKKERMREELGIEEEWLYEKNKYRMNKFVGKVFRRIQQ